MEEPLLSSSNPKRRFSIKETLNLGSLQGERDPRPSPLGYSSSDLGIIKQQLIYGSFRLHAQSDDDQDCNEELGSERHDSFGEIPIRCFTPRSEIVTTPRSEIVTSPQRFSSLLDSLSLDIKGDDTTGIPKSGPDVPTAVNPFKRRTLRKSRTAPAMVVMPNSQEGLRRPNAQPPQPIVKTVMLVLLAYLAFGLLIYHVDKDDYNGIETNSFVDSLYFCIVTMCTIGYGDITPKSTTTKLLACLFVIVAFGFIDILLSGMVSLVLSKQEGLLLHSLEGEHHEIAQTYLVDVKKGRMRIRMKVAFALGVVVLCIGVGAIVMHTLEKLDWVDSFYLSVMSVTTVGYGDQTFKTMLGRLFASVWLLVSTLAVARAFLYLAEARIDKRHRMLAKWILQKDMTVQDLFAADIDLNGFVSKSEFVVYKLKQMGRVEPKDIDEICKQFDRLDTDNSGKITLSLLSKHDA